MAGWVDELLKEWRERFEALAQRDHAAPLEDDGSPPTHALDLLRTHVARSGVQLTLSDPIERRQLPERRTAHLKDVDTGARRQAPASGADAGPALFGRRQYAASTEGASERLSRVPQEALRTPAETRRAAEAFRAAAYGEVEAMRADISRLKEALADVLVENRSLKRMLQAQPDAEAG